LVGGRHRGIVQVLERIGRSWRIQTADQRIKSWRTYP